MNQTNSHQSTIHQESHSKHSFNSQLSSSSSSLLLSTNPSFTHQTRSPTLKTSGLPLRFRQLNIYSDRSDQVHIKTLPRAFASLFTTPFTAISSFIRLHLLHQSPHDPRKILILSHLNGLLEPSELLLLLGRSGSGVTSTLRALSSTDARFSVVDGQLDYGSLSPAALRQLGLNSEVALVEETDDHFPTLTLAHTLGLALRCKTPVIPPDNLSRSEWLVNQIQTWTRAFRMSPATLETPVGSGLSLGLSGGERRRTSIMEGLQTDCSILFVDNATAGLDSSTARQVILSLKEWARLGHRGAVLGLRQGSDSIYNLFDKLLLLYEGHQIYFGPISEAVDYFEHLGFERASGQPTADFLCAVTDPATRPIRPGFELRVPRTPADFVAAYEQSTQFVTLKQEMIDYESRYPSAGPAHDVICTHRAKKDRWTSSCSPWTVNYLRQVAYLVLRQWALIRADLRPYATKTIVNLMLSFIIGSLFFQLPSTTEAAFTRGSVLFLSIMFNGYLQLSELANTLAGRPIVQRHARFGFYSPSALAMARTISDLPIIAFQVLLFGSITYLMAGLQADWSHFSVYLLIGAHHSFTHQPI